jgi:hypothetical protein
MRLEYRELIRANEIAPSSSRPVVRRLLSPLEEPPCKD